MIEETNKLLQLSSVKRNLCNDFEMEANLDLLLSPEWRSKVKRQEGHSEKFKETIYTTAYEDSSECSEDQITELVEREDNFSSDDESTVDIKVDYKNYGVSEGYLSDSDDEDSIPPLTKRENIIESDDDDSVECNHYSICFCNRHIKRREKGQKMTKPCI